MFGLSQPIQPIPKSGARGRTRGWLPGLTIGILVAYGVWSRTSPAYAMHIMEGFLPMGWAVFWWILSLPCFLLGLRSLTQITQQNPELKLLLALVGAFS